VTTDRTRHDRAPVTRLDGRPPEPWEVALRDGAPATIAGWKALVEGLLTNQCCAFHRNMEISSHYAWMYGQRPVGFKWAAMAALASHHVRLALFPLRVDSDGTGYVDLPRSLARRRLLLTPGDGSESVAARREAEQLVWDGTLQLLEHEQRALVQPNFDHLSCAFARLVSIAATTSFEVRGVRQEVACFTSFYLHSLRQGVPHARQVHAWPRITHFEDRWRWLETSVVPRFRRVEADRSAIGGALRRIAAEARVYASIPCVPPG
jgi:hypothetical protein